MPPTCLDLHGRARHAFQRMQHDEAGAIGSEVGFRRRDGAERNSTIGGGDDLGAIGESLLGVAAAGVVGDREALGVPPDLLVGNLRRVGAPVLVADEEGDGAHHLDTAEPDVAQGAVVEHHRDGTGAKLARPAVGNVGSEELDGARRLLPRHVSLPLPDGLSHSDDPIGLRIDQDGAAHVEIDLDAVARLRHVMGVELGNDTDAAQDEGDVDARAGGLNDLHLDGKARMTGARRSAGSAGDGLRPDAEKNVAATLGDVAGETGRHGNARAFAELELGMGTGSGQAGRNEVDLRRAEEAGDEAGRRPFIKIERRSRLLDLAARS